MKLSLKSKVILVVLLFTVILSTCTIMLSYLTYINSFQSYYEGLAAAIAKPTATVVDNRQEEAVADEAFQT